MKKYYQKKSLTLMHSDPYRRLSTQLTATELAALANVTEQTAYKWINGTHPMHPHTRAMLTVQTLGILPFEHWQGFVIDPAGAMVTPNGYTVTAGEVEGFGVLKQLNSALQVQLAKVQAELAELKAARPDNVIPLPGQTRQGA